MPSKPLTFLEEVGGQGKGLGCDAFICLIDHSDHPSVTQVSQSRASKKGAGSSSCLGDLLLLTINLHNTSKDSPTPQHQILIIPCSSSPKLHKPQKSSQSNQNLLLQTAIILRHRFTKIIPANCPILRLPSQRLWR